jgi:mono/diheme cytochrome c family protein
MHRLRRTALLLAIVLALAAAGGAGFIVAGVYNVAATEPHSALAYYVLHYAMQRSVKARVKDIRVPDLAQAERIDRGLVLYRQHCLQCHGAPGVAPEAAGFGTRPVPANLAEIGRSWSAPELYWVVRHGIKMTAMPGWEFRLNDSQLWDLVAFVKQLPAISPQQYRAASARLGSTAAAASAVASSAVPATGAGVPERGRHAIDQYLCATCHRIPGVADANADVGPSLAGVAARRYLGGVIVNTPDNMVRWIQHPQQIDPLSAMPELNIRDQDARDIAAYLEQLK